MTSLSWETKGFLYFLLNKRSPEGVLGKLIFFETYFSQKWSANQQKQLQNGVCHVKISLSKSNVRPFSTEAFNKVLTGCIFCLLFVEDWNLNQLGRNCCLLGHQWKQQTDWDIDLQAPLDLAGVGSQWPYCPQNIAQCQKHVLHKCTQFTLKTKMFAILKSNETIAIPKLRWNPEPLREVKIGLSCWRLWEI